jgi:hypothetical protein
MMPPYCEIKRAITSKLEHKAVSEGTAGIVCIAFSTIHIH